MFAYARSACRYTRRLTATGARFPRPLRELLLARALVRKHQVKCSETACVVFLSRLVTLRDTEKPTELCSVDGGSDQMLAPLPDYYMNFAIAVEEQQKLFYSCCGVWFSGPGTATWLVFIVVTGIRCYILKLNKMILIRAGVMLADN